MLSLHFEREVSILFLQCIFPLRLIAIMDESYGKRRLHVVTKSQLLFATVVVE